MLVSLGTCLPAFWSRTGGSRLRTPAGTVLWGEWVLVTHSPVPALPLTPTRLQASHHLHSVGEETQLPGL